MERLRAVARVEASISALEHRQALDEHDLLALWWAESKGDPNAVSRTGYRGLGQFGQPALQTYNDQNASGRRFTWDQMLGEENTAAQAAVSAWYVGWARAYAETHLKPADISTARDLWGDGIYSWGAGHMREIVAAYRANHGVAPTWQQAKAENPTAGAGFVRVWMHAEFVRSLAAASRGAAPAGGVLIAEKKNEAGGLSAGIAAGLAVAGVFAVGLIDFSKGK